jgi:hypothetical protein
MVHHTRAGRAAGFPRTEYYAIQRDQTIRTKSNLAPGDLSVLHNPD